MTDTSTEALIEQIEEQTPEDSNELGEDLDRSVRHFAEQLDLGNSDRSHMGISPEKGLALLRPMIRSKATSDPETTLRALAVIHLESGALLDEHSDLDPVDLIK